MIELKVIEKVMHTLLKFDNIITVIEKLKKICSVES